MSLHPSPARGIPTPIPGLLVLPSGAASDEFWTRPIWPLPAAVQGEFATFTPGRLLASGSESRGATSPLLTRTSPSVITVLSGRVAVGCLDLRPGGRTRSGHLVELDAGSSLLMPAGVAFACQVLTAPAQFSEVVGAGGTDGEPATLDPFDPDAGITWPIPPPLARVVPGAPTVPLSAALHESAPTAPQEPFRVLFVCTANICRSAYADLAANAHPHPGIVFASAGVQALTGRPIDPPMAARLGAQVDATAHRARQLTRAEMARADLVLAMAAEHRRFILEEWPDLGRKTFVLGHVAREIQSLPSDVTLAHLADHLWRRRTTDPDDDVADPYRRGEEAADAAARKLDGYVEALIEGLDRLAGHGRS